MDILSGIYKLMVNIIHELLDSAVLQFELVGVRDLHTI